MKRFRSIILCLLMVFSISTNAFAADGSPANVLETQAIELSAGSSMLNETDIQFATLDTAEVFDQEIDFTNAINITSDIMTASVDSSDINEVENMLAASPTTAAVNQAPVGSPDIFLLNSDSVRDGQYTTASVFFIATRWNNTDLCYDPDGGSLTLIHNTSFPTGYIAQVADSAGT